MYSAEELRQLCPDCPLINELADRRKRLLVKLALDQDRLSKSERQVVWRRADWDDQDARELARTCLKRTFSFDYRPHCTSFPDD